MKNVHACVSLAVATLLAASGSAQTTHDHQADFPPEEFQARRARLFDALGENALGIVQGAPNVQGFTVFRQTNTFYYLTGVAVPHAYLLLDARRDRTTLYLPHRERDIVT